MTEIHAALGFLVAVTLVSLVVWALVARVARRPPGGSYMRIATGVAALVSLQVIVGATRLFTGGEAETLHPVYGILTLVVLGAGLGVGRALERDGWVAVAWSSVIALGLGLRAFTTG